MRKITPYFLEITYKDKINAMNKNKNSILNSFRIGSLSLVIFGFCMFNIFQSSRNIIYSDRTQTPYQASDHTQAEKPILKKLPVLKEVPQKQVKLKEPQHQRSIASIKTPEKSINEKIALLQKPLTKKIVTPEKKKIKKVVVSKTKTKVSKKVKSKKIAKVSKKIQSFSHRDSGIKIKVHNKKTGQDLVLPIEYRILASTQSSINAFKSKLPSLPSQILDGKVIEVNSSFLSQSEKSKVEKELVKLINKKLPKDSKIDRLLISKFFR